MKPLHDTNLHYPETNLGGIIMQINFFSIFSVLLEEQAQLGFCFSLFFF